MAATTPASLELETLWKHHVPASLPPAPAAWIPDAPAPLGELSIAAQRYPSNAGMLRPGGTAEPARRGHLAPAEHGLPPHPELTLMPAGDQMQQSLQVVLGNDARLYTKT